MVQSPNKTFSCLIYLHRYTQDTFLQILNNYFRPYLQKLESRLVQLEKYQVKVSNTMEERIDSKKEIEIISKQLKECKKWEENSLLPIAQQRIKINLDDGVKENYLKFDTVLAEIPGFKKES